MSEWIAKPIKDGRKHLGDEYMGDLIRCKDCKHYYEKEWVVGGGSYTTCWYQTIANAQPDDYCSRAERRENET